LCGTTGAGTGSPGGLKWVLGCGQGGQSPGRRGGRAVGAFRALQNGTIRKKGIAKVL